MLDFDFDYVANDIVQSLWLHRPVSVWSNGVHFSEFYDHAFPKVRSFLKEVYGK